MRKVSSLVSVPVAAFVLLSVGARGVVGQGLPLSAASPRDQGIAPYFEGWYANEDGTFTFSLGYFNFNTNEAVYIPIGPDNKIEPEEFSGMQPTFFPAAEGRDRKEVGAFGVTVPAEFADGRHLVWTITRNGKTFSVPAHVGVEAYQLDYDGQAMGSVPPRLKLRQNGPEGIGPGGLMYPDVLEAKVGEPMSLTVWVTDPSVRGGLGVTTDVPIGLTWYRHQGPGEVDFARPEGEGGGDEDLADNQVQLPDGGGQGTILATFTQPGDYVLRVRADNFGADDSRPSDQCCWTNGFYHVSVSP